VPEVSLLVEFFERDPPPSSKRLLGVDATAIFRGTAAAAQAIKWSVEGQGGEFEVHNPVPGNVGAFGDDAAPPTCSPSSIGEPSPRAACTPP
jgi:hypothetical protein